MRQLQSGNASLINTADNFHIKELDWKSKTMTTHIPESKIRHGVS